MKFGNEEKEAMNINITEEPLTSLAEYARVPISFEVNQVMDVSEDGLGGFTLSPRRHDKPYIKDYDAITGEGPLEWAKRFDLTNWGFFMARVEGRCVGGAAMAWKCAGCGMLEGRTDLAVMWDIRVAPEVRRQGIGSALFRAAEAWSVARGCTQLKVETQSINVAACRFYARQGCVLKTVNPLANPQFPEEIQLLWYKTIA